LLRIIQRFILENQEAICAVSARDSGKPMVDAAFGEVMVTLEKIQWLCAEGERWLLPEKRSAGCAWQTRAHAHRAPCHPFRPR
jgi:acyl-CoA reductase-like NAD-dependent aldehyde dehydrogenase